MFSVLSVPLSVYVWVLTSSAVTQNLAELSVTIDFFSKSPSSNIGGRHCLETPDWIRVAAERWCHTRIQYMLRARNQAMADGRRRGLFEKGLWGGEPDQRRKANVVASATALPIGRHFSGWYSWAYKACFISKRYWQFWGKKCRISASPSSEFYTRRGVMTLENG